MTFEVIPALDLWAGKLVSLRGGEPRPLDAFDGNPLAAATHLVDAGARWLHVVDAQLAYTGQPVNVELVRRIAGLGVPVQASGGVAHDHEVEGMLEAGAARVVLGSAALADRELTERLIGEHGERLVVGLEVAADVVRPRGRGPDAVGSLDDVLSWLAATDAPRFLFTGVADVGGMLGPDYEGVARVRARTGRPVIGAGGVGSVEHLERLRAVGAEAAVAGAALLQGRIDLAAALRRFRDTA